MIKLALYLVGMIFKMKVTIYGKANCKSCDEAKQLCNNKSVEYEYKQMGKDFELLEMYSIAPRNHKSFPMIAIDGKYLGGLVELKEVLVNQAH